MVKLVEPELSYKIVGLCFQVHSQLGSNHKEKYYQRALELAFIENKISFRKEIKVDLDFNKNKIGCYFLDFLVNNKIIVELKAKPFISRSDIKQVLSYLESKDIELGLIINFGNEGLEHKRILNSKFGKIRPN